MAQNITLTPCLKHNANDLYCKFCGHVRELAQDINYYQLYGITPPSFEVDQDGLRKAYFDLQTLMHPDNFIGKSHKVQMAAMHNSSVINQGYTTLSNEFLRARYLVELHLPPALAESKLDQEFMIDAMELHEKISAANADVGALTHEVAQIKNKLWDDFKGFAQEHQWQDASNVLDKLNIINKLSIS